MTTKNYCLDALPLHKISFVFKLNTFKDDTQVVIEFPMAAAGSISHSSLTRHVSLIFKALNKL